MMLSGNLTDWSVGDLLQMLHITKKTASLHISGADRSGVVHFEGGAIVNADVSLGGGAADHPRDEVIEAVYVLELLDEGTFEIKGEVPSRTIDPLPVAEALELAGKHLDAERHLDDTGLLAARGLRLAQTIEEPIILSEQVWNAISASIPAFTFPDLEQRLGRAGAISTIEQFRDLGILEAVLDDMEPAASMPQPEVVVDAEQMYAEHRSSSTAPELTTDEQIDAQLAEAFEETWTEEAGEDVIVPEFVEDVRPIVAAAADDSIIVPVEDDSVAAPEPVEQPATAPSGASSLSAAIRAAAEAGGAADVHTNAHDDESVLLSEAAGEAPVGEGEATADAVAPRAEDGSLRRTVRSLVSPPETALVSGVLGDLGSRFRHAAAAGDKED
jgi:hypothetical protein